MHGPGAGGLVLSVEEPYDGYDMEESGAVVVYDRLPPPLETLVGAEITRVALLVDAIGAGCGFALEASNGESAALVNLADELVADVWPSQRLMDFGVQAR